MTPSGPAVFRRGKGTRTLLTTENGKMVMRVVRGKGEKFVGDFSSLDAARQFCKAELSSDPTADFLIVEGTLIVERIFDSEYQSQKSRRSKRTYTLCSLVFVMAWGSCIALACFQAPLARVVFIGCVALLYAGLWTVHKNPMELAVFMIIVLTLGSMLIRAWRKAQEMQRLKANPTPHSALAIPRLKDCASADRLPQ